MIISAQRFSFKPGVCENDKSRALAAVAALAEAEPVEFAFVGRDLGDPAGGFTHGFSIGLADLDALERYFDHPLHAAADRALLPLLQKTVGTGLSDDDDADLRAKIVELHQRRVQRDPEYVALLSAIPEIALLHQTRSVK
ncbi:Dabb family protein [Mycolicibacterium wolinskyi]|uniref:Stress-response A/B barrel domain-containing protein n=1 Tax=Mycolicibacterium wolinskyi TaxID=59750 RepID=A0A1X2FK33_9MYCO|nr:MULTISPECIES: Dabb family protein [Mycolicibacterium]MCV7289437.1 Dabb family protein [Mycolicibacterium wolinskyi]MCV7297430.1 Dabb family protein [Mycolicibacterium goodii]ORX18795.1 hypothetical protein AWC31_12540 [Mycolicibacterium wolinskyi]